MKQRLERKTDGEYSYRDTPVRAISVLDCEIVKGNRIVNKRGCSNAWVVETRVVPQYRVEVKPWTIRVATEYCDLHGDIIFHGDIVDVYYNEEWRRGEVFQCSDEYEFVPYNSKGICLLHSGEERWLSEIDRNDIEIVGTSLSKQCEEYKIIDKMVLV